MNRFISVKLIIGYFVASPIRLCVGWLSIQFNYNEPNSFRDSYEQNEEKMN